MSSYVPTFKLFARARETFSDAQMGQDLGVQVVAMLKTIGYKDLSSCKEVEVIR